MKTAGLDGVPETMLWTLHNRAREAMRPDAWLQDSEAVRIYHSIECDFDRRFGRPDGSHAVRSLAFDDALRPWLERHPDGSVVELGCGLETQFQRCDNGRVRWLCVDVPEALDVRERFLPASKRCRHIRKSALDRRWMDAVDPSRPVFVSAQGLFMYFAEAQVRELVVAMLERFAGVELMFDAIPRWFSRLTTSRRGLHLTPDYRTPPMPWGLDADEIEPLLLSWSPRIAGVEVRPYPRFRGAFGVVQPILLLVPGLRGKVPSIVRVSGTQSS